MHHEAGYNPESKINEKNDRKSLDLLFSEFIIDSLPIAVVAVDPDLKITRFNSWAKKLTGYSKEQAIGRHCGDVLRGAMCGPDCPLKRVIRRQQSMVTVESTIQTKQNDTIPIRMNTAALFDEEGELLGGVEAFQDISVHRKLQREKANLISMFVHDMSSSVTGIHGLGLRLLKSEDLNEEMSRKYIEVIAREAEKLDALVQDFLEFSRLETGRIKLNFCDVSLSQELSEVFELYQPKASQDGIQLELHIPADLPTIEADANRLHRVFTNLLDNALKFSKEGDTITITAQETKEEVMVRFKDEGIGISPEELPHIFDLFHRGPRGDKVEGYGVGLASVKAIVEGHGGRVFVSSETDKGSTFTVLLPKLCHHEH
jgi:two-component system phosphate regulon sensor histidine kinase PhoR